VRCRALLAARLSFTLETTLSSHSAMTILREAIDAGYQTMFGRLRYTEVRHGKH
jgi:predicted ABC-type ATPase